MKKLFIVLFSAFFILGCSKDVGANPEDCSPSDEICFFGDSMTAGGNWVSLTGNPNCVNLGKGGSTTSDMLARLDDVIRLNPCKVFLMAGVNDLRAGCPVDETAGKIGAILDILSDKLPCSKVYLQSILPVNRADFIGQTILLSLSPNDIVILNAKLKALTMKTGAIYLDLYPYFTDDNDALQASISTDGLHLNAQGYAKWASLIRILL